MRLIDADELCKRITNEPSAMAEIIFKNTGNFQYLTAMADRQNEIWDMISEMPTIDPESLRPVGRWETVKRQEHYPSLKEYEADYCSNCGKRGELEYSYCPHCGARMEVQER